MARSIRMRRWQREALDHLESSDRPDFLAVATPGAGKTTFALVAARRALAQRRVARLVVVAPTQALKAQWAAAAAAVDLHLEPDWSAADGRLPHDLHGIVTTYQQLASSPRAVGALARDAFAVLDEVHHAGDDRAWGDAVREAFDGSAVRLALSGTPFRSDTQAIPFVRYEADEAQPDFAYGYGDALRDRGVVRPVYFPRLDGRMEWVGADGERVSASFADRLDAVRAAQRLRTALSVDGDWLATVLREAHRRLRRIREDHPRAGGLVIATDQEHARGIAALMRRRLGVEAVLALSEDPRAADRIARFARGDEPWIIAVRMVSEGVDIPRLRVGVFATTTTTELFFRQAVGRLVRWTRGLGPQRAYLFLPDDARLRAHALGIAEERRHVLRRPDDAEAEDEREAAEAATPDHEQLSLFAAISAVALGAPEELPPPAGHDEHDPGEEDDGDDADAPILELPPLPGPQPAPGVPPRERRRDLREANAHAARELAHLTGLTHAQVNAELNRLTGVRRVTEATLDELAARHDHAERWLRRLASA